MPAFYHAADLLVHPTYYDPCSRVVLEALAAGLPVITTRFNGAAERITSGRQGYVLESPDDVAGLAQAIVRLCDDEHRHSCAKAASGAITGISMREHARRACRLYEELVASGEPKRGGYR
jgi:UDP-glucose:(heptosyl)LPS alpha-1,3-glucosyltransferase